MQAYLLPVQISQLVRGTREESSSLDFTDLAAPESMRDSATRESWISLVRYSDSRGQRLSTTVRATSLAMILPAHPYMAIFPSSHHLHAPCSPPSADNCQTQNDPGGGPGRNEMSANVAQERAEKHLKVVCGYKNKDVLLQQAENSSFNEKVYL